MTGRLLNRLNLPDVENVASVYLIKLHILPTEGFVRLCSLQVYQLMGELEQGSLNHMLPVLSQTYNLQIEHFICFSLRNH